MKTLILSFSNNLVNEESFIPNRIGLTFSCVEVCEKELKKHGYEVEHICIQKDDFIDGLHPNQKGHKKIFERIKKYLNEKSKLQ